MSCGKRWDWERYKFHEKGMWEVFGNEQRSYAAARCLVGVRFRVPIKTIRLFRRELPPPPPTADQDVIIYSLLRAIAHLSGRWYLSVNNGGMMTGSEKLKKRGMKQALFPLCPSLLSQVLIRHWTQGLCAKRQHLTLWATKENLSTSTVIECCCPSWTVMKSAFVTYYTSALLLSSRLPLCLSTCCFIRKDCVICAFSLCFYSITATYFYLTS
jgi:hypothetical protein